MNNQDKPNHSQIITDEKYTKTLQHKLKNNSWKVRKEASQQVLDLIDQLNSSNETFYIQGKAYQPSKLIKIFEDLVDQQHPSVLLIGLECVIKLLQKKLCSKRSFVKLLDKGFDKFPLRVNRGKQIMQKFADIIELVSPQASLVGSKLSGNNQKCVMFALQVACLLNMDQLKPRIKQISQKHPKKAVKQLAKQIYDQLNQIQVDNEQKQQSMFVQEQNDPIQTNIDKKKKKQEKNQSNFTPSRSDMIIVQKLPHYQQLNMNSKQYQNYSELLLNLAPNFQYFPQNQLTSLSHVLRLMIEGSNFVINFNGIKILKILIDNKSSLIPRSYPLLFIFDKFKLHSSHQINGLLYQLADSLFLHENRAIDLVQAILDGSSSKKANVKYGCVMLLVRLACIISCDNDLFKSYFEGSDIPQINHSSEIIVRLKKMLSKGYDLIYGSDKKYDQILNNIRFIIMSSSGTTSTTKKFKDTKSTIGKYTKPSTNKLQNKASVSSFKQTVPKQSSNSIKRTSSTRTQISTNNKTKYKIINPQENLKMILKYADQNRKKQLKQAISVTLQQLKECIDENRFQIFYYAELIQNFISQYQAVNEDTVDIISEFITNFLIKVSGVGQKQSQKPVNFKKNAVLLNIKNIQIQGIAMILKICLCDLYLGNNQLQSILYNLSGFGIQKLILKSLQRIEGKIKKKNRKIIINWIDANVPHQYLCDELFELMQKIEAGKYIGEQQVKINKIEPNKYNQIEPNKYNQIEPYKYNQIKHQKYNQIKHEKRVDNSLPQYDDISQIEHNNNISDDRTLIQDQEYLKNLKTSRQNKDNANQNRAYEQKYLQQYNQQKHQQKHQYENDKYNKQQRDQYVYTKNNRLNKQNNKQYEQQLQNKEDEQSMYLDIQNYKKYIQKIRENYLPKSNDNLQRTQQQQLNQQKQISYKNSEQNELQSNLQQKTDGYQNDQNFDRFQQLQERLRKMKQFAHQHKQQSSLSLSLENSKKQQQVEISRIPSQQHFTKHQKVQAQSQEFNYKIIKVDKLKHMLRNSTNPYSHLRNQILVPFKNHQNKTYFLKQLTYFLVQDQFQIVNRFPQPYNAILLLVILLFAQIQSNKALIKPLQQLYQHMASLCSTNDFLKTIISLFHSVIEQTVPRLRTFLITILTKSVSRLMVFAEDPVTLLRDLSQFYNIGQNVYFQMYEAQYKQIRDAIQGDALEEVVEKALVQQGQHLVVIVQSWFQTKLKQKVQYYMQNIITQNEQNNQQDN